MSTHERTLALAATLLVLAAAPATADLAAEASRARSIQAARRLQALPEPFGPALNAADLSRDLVDLASLEAPLLQKGTWRLLRSGENARHVTFSGDGLTLAWIDEARLDLRVWTMGGEPVREELDGSWVDYLSLDQDGTRALVGLHHFQREETEAAGVQIIDDLRHLLRAVGGPEALLASCRASTVQRHGQASFVGDRVLLLESDLALFPGAPWPVPTDLEALWLEPSFQAPPIDLDLRGVAYTLLRRPATRALAPAWAPLADKVFVGMGVDLGGVEARPPRLVLRGLKPLGSHPGAFAELGHAGNLEFDVPGAPLSLAASPDGKMFAYTHGTAGGMVDLGETAGMRLVPDGVLARPSPGIWLLRPGRDPVRVPHPHEAPVYEVAWRPNGLELLVSTDLDEDGTLDLAVYDLTPVLRNQQRRWAVLGKPRPADQAPRVAAAPPASAAPAAPEPSAAATPEEPVPTEPAAEPPEATEAPPVEPAAPAPTKAAAAPSRPASGELERLVAAGEKALLAGHAVDALARSDEAAELAPEAFAPAWLHARAAHSAGDLEGAGQGYRELLEHPGLPADVKPQVQARANMVDGQELLTRRKVGPGLAKLARAVGQWEAGENPAFAVLVHECVERKLFSDGLRYAERWVKAGGGEERKLFSDGLRYAERWVKAGGGDVARESQVRLLSGAGRHDDAIELSRALVRKNSFSAEEKVLLGDALLAGGKPEEALQVFREAKTLAPDQGGIDSRIFEAESAEVLGSQ
jgi:tetratricopeptide (TPR) repeat protein